MAQNNIFIPFDLVEKIFSHIPTTDHATLSACSQTSKSFRDSMQGRLFEVINVECAVVRDRRGDFTLADIKGVDTVHQLLSSLTTKPTLASYIRSFNIIGTELFPSRMTMRDPLGSPTPSIFRILSLLTSLTAFSFSGDPTSRDLLPIKERHISSDLKEAIQSLFMRSSASIKSVALTAIRDFPLEKLRHLPNIETLHVPSLIDTHIALPPGLINPKVLHIGDTRHHDSKILVNLLRLLTPTHSHRPTMTLSRIESLCMISPYASQNETHQHHSMKNYSMPPMQHLNTPYNDIANFNLARFHNLASLTLSGTLMSRTMSSAHPIVESRCRWMGAILSTLPQITVQDSSYTGPQPPLLSLFIEIGIYGAFTPADISALPFGQFTDVLNAAIDGGAMIKARIDLHFLNCKHRVKSFINEPKG
ncbi:hypothetical protein CVT24_007320 [Panaeolus cyanescens]|uniref:F-box domain-containing protein n=1 Tax=Panaeolus cyanescens TaxID=181874 RepID=A0A409WZ69_9AGAR|nr:hypothetical protein CVT24_007320 [Panaeolus cyanescens]